MKRTCYMVIYTNENIPSVVAADLTIAKRVAQESCTQGTWEKHEVVWQLRKDGHTHATILQFTFVPA